MKTPGTLLTASLLITVLCTAGLLANPSTLSAAPLCPAPDAAIVEAIEASAQHFSTRTDGRVRLTGAVQLEQGNNRIRADRVIYAPDLERVQASGDVRYTNCKAKNPAWFLASDRVTLDRKRKTATAKNAWLVIGNTPLFYLPRYWLTLDDQRKSGFLSPDIGDSSNTGIELGAPYYFNLAPNHDAILEPRLLSKRGLQFLGNYRYLHRYNKGTFSGDWLNDTDYDGGTRNNDSKRYSYSLDHQTAVSDKLRMQLQLQKVSDADYIEDLSGSFDLLNENYLNSKLLADYVWRGWHLNFTAENFQRADTDTVRRNDLYERQPSVSLSKNLYSSGLNLDLSLRSEWTSFNRKYDSALDATLNPEGDRFDHEITLRWPHRRPGFHFTPSAGLRQTDYKLNERDDESRTLPWFSLRTGLAFEKMLHKGRYRSTLEPELFYLNVPYKSQGNLPVFDTSVAEFRFAQLFDNNRFNGPDRISEADQLTLALSTRLIHARSGKEAVRLSVGHTRYFRDRNVSLPDEDTSESRDDYSDLATEFALNLNEKVKFTASMVWDTEEGLLDRHSTRLSFNAGNNKIINLSNHYLRGDDGFSQSEIGLHLPFGPRWNWFGGLHYDVRADKDLGFMSGLRYNSCCWSLQLVGQRRLQNIDGDDQSIENGSLDYNTSIGIEFNLQGLTSVGVNNNSRLLEKWIQGYRQ